jgi:SAM-dependent methyltransferase
MHPIAPDYQTPKRMAAKLAAIPLPDDLTGARVLDVGTDFGAFAFLAEQRGAVDVLGLDRGRAVRGQGKVDLVEMNRAVASHRGSKCRFERIDLGRQWLQFGRFDIVLLCSLYHHVFENCRDHRAIWFWLRQHCAEGAELLFEGPVDDSDPVVCANVSADCVRNLTLPDILQAASIWFDAEYIGPALHEPTREVWRFTALPQMPKIWSGEVRAGAGGASKAFTYAEGRRVDEIERALGVKPEPGSMNVRLDIDFDWSKAYLRARILDVVDRSKGLASEWQPRWARFYPVTVEGHDAWIFRFEGECYPENFVELIAPVRLRDYLTGDRVTLLQ